METDSKHVVWSQQLEQFNDSNAGRLTCVETDGAVEGPPSDDGYYFLRRVSCNSTGERIEITLDDLRQADRAVTHAITDAVTIDVQASRDGRDTALWIDRKGGRLLLRLF